MTDEQMQNLVQFLLEQQVQTAVKVDALADSVKGLAGSVNGLAEAHRRSEEKWSRTEEGIRSLLAIAELHEGEIEALREALKETQARMDKRVAEINERMAETDERLNALINTVERYISERRNGRSEG